MVNGELSYEALERRCCELEARLEAAASLRATEDRYRLLMQNSSSGIAIHQIVLNAAGCPSDYVFLAVNPKFEEHTGLRGADIIGRPITSVFRTGTAPFIDIYGQVARGGDPVRFETFFEPLDRHFAINAFRIGPGQFATVFEDITGRKHAEETLNDTVLWLEAAVRAGRVGLWDWDLKANEVRFSAEWKRQIGFAENEIGNGFEEWKERVHPDDLVHTLDRIHAAITEGVPNYEVEFRLRHRDGSYRWMLAQASIIKDSSNNPVRVIGSHVDITDRKQADERMRTMAAMLDTAPSAIMVHDFNGNILYANQEAFDMHGYDEREFMALNLHQIDVPESEALIAERMRLVAEHGEARFEVEHFRKDGTQFPLEIYVKKVAWDEIPAILSVGTDISERKRAEQERARLEGQYLQAQKMEAIGQLTGGVAHDFNNMLQAISGYTDIATDELDPGHPARESLAVVAEAAARASRLVEHLLLFSRRRVMRPALLDLNETVEGLLKMLRRVIGEHIRIEWLPAPRLGSIHADQGMLEQVLMNLCVNARDAMQDGGTLTIETATVRIDEQFCDSHAWAVPGRYVLLMVNDTGCGMDKETLEHIFESFFTTKELGKGTGLGLATVYGIVKQHGGMIGVYSEPGKGTLFKLYLPLCERKAEDVGASFQPLPKGGSETILLAEDDEIVRRITRTILGNAGYNVLIATDGAEAVAMFRQRADEIDLAVLDVVMPELGGRAAYEQMREVRHDIRALFTSGYSETAIQTNFVLGKGLKLLQKPYGRDALLLAVREAIDAPSDAGRPSTPESP